MLFAPFAMQSGAAMAAMPSDHHAQAMAEEHCEAPPAGDVDGKAAEKPCCAAMCSAIAFATGSPVEEMKFLRAVETPSREPFRHVFLAKLPTPPPRLA